MRIETSKVREGHYIGETVWICHYLREDLNKKPLRNIEPTKVIIVDNSELPDNKRVYYSETHFLALSKKGVATKKVISPVDNTGWRSHCGNELNIFTTEEECIAQWNSEISEVCDLLEIKEKYASEQWRKERELLELRKVGDFV